MGTLNVQSSRLYCLFSFSVVKCGIDATQFATNRVAALSVKIDANATNIYLIVKYDRIL